MISIPNPNCHLSHQKANKFCINSQCKSPAFICKFCQEDLCEKLHLHDKKIQTSFWSEFKPIIESTFTQNQYKQLQQSIKALQKQLQFLVEDINKTIKIYMSRVEEFNKYYKSNENSANIFKNLNEQNFQNISGSEMKKIYDQLMLNKLDQKQRNKNRLINIETQNIQNLFKKIKKEVDQFLNYELIIKKNSQVHKTLQNTNKQQMSKIQKRENQKKLKEQYVFIQDIEPGSQGIFIIVRILSVRKRIQKREKKDIVFLDCIVGDHTGISGASFYQNPLIQKGKVIELKNVYARVVNEHIVIQIGKYGQLLESHQNIFQVNLDYNISSKAYVQVK